MSRSRRKLENSTIPVRDVQRFLSLCALLVVAVLVVYLQTTDFSFVSLDDPTYVSDNSHVKAGLSLANIAWSFDGFHDGNWIPFTWLSLMLDTDLHGMGPGGYHLTNVLLHAANCLLLFAILVWMTSSQFESAFVAALFAIHPLHVESVAWVTERKDVLSIFFGLLALLAYVGYAKFGRWWTLAAAIACFTCSLLAKQTLVTLPFVFLLLDYWPLRRFETAGGTTGQSNRASRVRLIAEKLPFLAVSAVFSLIVIFAQRSSEWNSLSTPSKFPLATRLINAAVVYVTYLCKALIPRSLIVFYPYADNGPTWISVAVAAAVLVTISVVAVVFIRRSPFLFVGWAWYLGTLVPMIGIVQVGGQQMADRYTYFPMIGAYLAVTWLVPQLLPRTGVLRTRVLPGAAGVALCALAAVAFMQVGYWRDSVTLFRHALVCQPGDPFIQSTLGSALVSSDRVEEGLTLVESATQIPPPRARVHFGLGVVLQRIGRMDEAAAAYRRAIEIDDSNPEAHSNLAFILATQGKDQDARQHLLRAIEIDPNYPNSYGSLAYLCMKAGDYAGAVKYSEDALRLEPNMLVCRQTLASALRALGRNAEAQRELDELEALKQRSPGS